MKTKNLKGILRDLRIVNVDFIGIEINGAEIEALEGMSGVLNQDVNLVIAAQYKRFGGPSYKVVASLLRNKGFNVLVQE